MEHTPIRVISNFLSPVECAGWVNYINQLEKSEADQFTVYESETGRRLALQFGEKSYEENQARPDFDLMSDDKKLATGLIFSRIIEETRSAFTDSSELYPCVFWLAKQYPGSKVDLHEDTDGGADAHINYSSLVYLNTQQAGGELIFPRHNFTYRPQAGDLVVFDTQLAGEHSVLEIYEERYSLPVWLTRDPSFKLVT